MFLGKIYFVYKNVLRTYECMLFFEKKFSPATGALRLMIWRPYMD